MPDVVSIATLGDLIARGYRLTIHCDACGHRANPDIEALAARLGAGHSYLAPHLLPRLKCSACGAQPEAMTLQSPSKR